MILDELREQLHAQCARDRDRNKSSGIRVTREDIVGGIPIDLPPIPMPSRKPQAKPLKTISRSRRQPPPFATNKHRLKSGGLDFSNPFGKAACTSDVVAAMVTPLSAFNLRTSLISSTGSKRKIEGVTTEGTLEAEASFEDDSSNYI